ncbi:MAG: response regulator [Nibricoccus sp.]
MSICESNSVPPFGSESFSTANGDLTKPPKILLNILVVDDDDAVRNVLASVLRRASYTVDCASDGEEAWRLLTTGDYDGMVTDNEMPRMSGLELVRRLRALPSNLPVILISGRMPGSEEELEELISPGMALDKPFSFDKLLAAVCTVFTQERLANPVFNGHVPQHGAHARFAANRTTINR